MTRSPITKTRSIWGEITAPPLPSTVPPRAWRRNVGDGTLTVYVTRDPGDPPLWHLSITHQPNNQRSAGRYPTWDEIANARDQFLPADRSFVMRLPAADEYVAIHSTCFHLHEEATQ